MQFALPHISIIIPAKNEAGNIEPLVGEIMSQLDSNYLFEIVYVDDGSTDDTAHLVQNLVSTYPSVVRLVQHEKSVGQSTAIFTGVKYALGRLIVTMDADGQNNPCDINKLLRNAETYSEDKHFCIAGHRKQRKDTAWKRFQSRIANLVRAKLLGDDTPDTGCGLKIIPRNTYLALPYFDHMHRYLPALVKRMGGSIEVVEVSHRERQHGQSKYGMWGRLFAGLLDMLGVMWLQKRNKTPITTEYLRNE